MRVRLGSGLHREELVTRDEVDERRRGSLVPSDDGPQSTRVEIGSRQDADRALRRYAQDKQAMAGYRDMLRSLGRSNMTGRSDDDVIKALSTELWAQSVQLFVLRPEPVSGPTNSAAQPPALPPPVKAQARPKKGPWKLTVKVFTDPKWSWPKAPVTVEVKGSNGSTKSTVMKSNKSDPLEFRGDHDSQLDYEIKASAPGWEPLATHNVLLKNEDDKAREIELGPPKVHLRLHYEDPDEAVHAFPKDFPVTVVFDDNSTKDLKVEDDKGYVHFDIEKGKAKFTLKFDHAKVRCLVHPKDAGKVEVLEDQDDDKLRKHTTDGKRFFVLPKKWSLVHAKWDAVGVAIPQDGKIVIPDEGVGKKDDPAKLTLVPKCQYVRLEFHDRKYWKDHAKKRVSVPPVVLKGARKSDDAGAPTDPVAGTHDAVSNWQVEKDDAEKTCQCLPWIVVKKDDGTDLAKLDKEMLLEFTWEKGFVHSKSKTERVVEVLEPADAKRKPTKDRNQYYDLPKLWKSKCWWSRFTDKTKDKFFDELSDADIEISFTKSTPIAFSLDDVVLVDTAGTKQALKDRDRDDAEKDLAKHSRVALLHLDPEDSFKIKVHDPRALAPFHSKSEFKKEATGEKRRNVITDYPFNLRAVVFCSGFHDVHDKRTETADFAKKELLGARAARLDDADLSAKKGVSGWDAGDYGAAYVVKDAGNCDLHYLHYGETDGTTVYGALVTFHAMRFYYKNTDKPAAYSGTIAKIFHEDEDALKPAHNGDIGDKRNYITKGMGNAMTRWNAKDYQLEESDGKTDIVIKTRLLAEAKEFEDPANDWTTLGGKAQADGALVKNKLGSNMGKIHARLRESGYADEGEDWGDPPNNLPAHIDHGTVVAPAKIAFAHELGHASGLDDDYVYYIAQVAGLIRYAQYFPGMPYVIDKGSLMNSNRAIRLRQYWGRTNWVNDAAKAGKPLNPFLAARAFKVCYAPGGTETKYVFDLNDSKYRDIYKPAYTEANVSLDRKGKCDLHLYKLGEDEWCRILKGGPYDGILVVATKISLRFKDCEVHPVPKAWAANTAYAKGACVEQGGANYACIDAHTSGGAFDAAKWAEIDGAARSYNWTAGTDYDPKEWVTNHTYSCVTAHKAGAPQDALWVEIGADQGAWANGTVYAVTDVVQKGPATFVCAVAHTAGVFATDRAAGRWLLALTDRGAYANGRAYAVTDHCVDGGTPYVCKIAHTSGTFAADVAAGLWVRPASRPWAKVKDVVIADWAGALNRDLFAAVEGAAGKFRLADSGNALKKNYLRMFPQWELVASGAVATAGTHFTLEVTPDGSDTFSATNAAVKVGSDCKNATIIRYLFGLIDDDATGRGGQDLVAALTKADFPKVKAWMDTKATGTFAVEDIT